MRLNMKTIMTTFALICFMIMVTSCNLFKPKYGCPSNGKNVDAGKLASGDPEAERAARTAKKFRN
jgi:hypothetical protein